MTTLLWILAVAMIVIGVVGTVLPALPGAVFVFGGIALAAWIDGFAEISGWTVGVVAVLTVLAFAVDYVAAMLGDRPTMLLAADGFLRVGIQYAFLTFLIAYAIDSLHLPVTWGALIYALAHLFGAVGRVGWGWTSDRIFHGRRRGPYAAIAVTAAAGFALLALAGPLHWLILLASVAILGLSAAGFQGVGLSLLAEVGGKRAGAASGLVNALSFLGAALMVPLCGQLLDAGASFPTLFAILSALSLLTATITLALPSTPHEPPAHVAR